MNSGTANIIISEIFSFSITYLLFRPFMDLRTEPQVEIIITLFPFYALRWESCCFKFFPVLLCLCLTQANSEPLLL